MKSALEISSEPILQSQNLISFNYESPLEVSNSKIIGFISNKPNSINENYIYSLATIISAFLREKGFNKILINNSVNNFGIAFASIFYSIIAEDPTRKVLVFNENFGYSQKLARHYFINSNFDFLIDIEINWTSKNSNPGIITFFKKKLTFLTLEEEKFINSAEKTPFFFKNDQIVKPEKFPISYENIFKLQTYLNLDLENLQKLYQFYDPDSNFLANFLKSNFNLKTIKFLPIKKIFTIENIMKHVSDSSIIWKKITTSAKFGTNIIFWLRKNKIVAAYRKNFNFNIIKEKDLQLLFLNYLRQNWQNGKYFLVSQQSDDYIIDYIQKNFNAKIWRYCEYRENPETAILKIQSQNQEEIVLITAESIHFIPKNTKKDTCFGISSHFSALWYIKVFEFFAKNNQNILDIIKAMKNEVNMVFHRKISLEIPPSNFDKIVNLLINEKSSELKPQGFHITNSSLDKRSINLKVNLKKNDFYTLNYFKPKQKLTLSTHFLAKNHTEKQAVFLENALIDRLKLVNKDAILTKSNKKKNIIKFSIFISIIILILIILFYNFYNLSFVDGSPTKIFVKFYDFFFFPRLNRLIFVGAIIYMLFWNISTAFQLRQVFKNQGIKTRFKHLFVGAFIATFMQFSTPFSFGGEISYYWYLQRKQYPLKNISATLTYNAFVHQVFNLLIGLVLIPIGFVFYQELFNLDSWEKVIFFIWLIVNIFLNALVLLIIAIISLWKKLQYSLIKIFVWFLNLNFFKKIEDRQRLEFRFQFLMDNFKKHFSEVLSNKMLLAKILFIYKLPVFFINFSFAILVLAMEKGGFNLKNINFMHYLKFLSGFTILQISNNLSPSPGGVGTADVITKLIFHSFFSEKTAVNLDIFNFANRIFTWFLPYLISGIGIFTVWIGEKRIDRYKEIRKTMKNNLTLNYELKKHDTNFFRYVLIFWGIITISLFILIFVH
ncbi:UPF0104 family protein [Mycoplasma flocculare]|uniref:lysylphosphatidylglycerol synthase transmembrane domain-containing protein n=1 Tax=Mesomycoplasma flocculare TaxID=2128 RepID=UPI001371F6EC|nr:lysylphosphatidylglycerol synthase transmembrane domain-containing protein [Mesomycoplasma flocculare]MXR13766.1 UPF0104 family protein [Mesomycoplasma flocculare]